MAKEDRGFASMDHNKQREIASKGGRAAHSKGTAHEWTCEEARGEDSARLWRAVREVGPLAAAPASAVWRVSVAPSAGPALAASVARALDCAHFFDWGGGLVWLAVPAAGDGGAAIIRSSLPACEIAEHVQRRSKARPDSTCARTPSGLTQMPQSIAAVTRCTRICPSSTATSAT